MRLLRRLFTSSTTALLTSTTTTVTSMTAADALAASSSSMANKNARTALDEHSTKGAFVRRDAAWRNWIRADGKPNADGMLCVRACVVHTVEAATLQSVFAVA